MTHRFEALTGRKVDVTRAKDWLVPGRTNVLVDGQVVGWHHKNRDGRWLAFLNLGDRGLPLGTFTTRREAEDEIWIRRWEATPCST